MFVELFRSLFHQHMASTYIYMVGIYKVRQWISIHGGQHHATVVICNMQRTKLMKQQDNP